jgi:hypothetical protein
LFKNNPINELLSWFESREIYYVKRNICQHNYLSVLV